MLLGSILGLILVLLTGGCSQQHSTSAPKSPDACGDSDGPTPAAVRRAIAAVPIVVPHSAWVEVTRGHTRNCRLYWVQIIPTIASESTPQQLLFFSHNAPLGSPTPNPRPYITVLPPGDDTVTVEYRWRVSGDKECCPSGKSTVRFQIGPDGALQARGAIPHE
ncbi:LppP/LprE family lipoprotein [Mycobacterium spongiae]|uniref:LppP/LprE family lipoprotein n=1 Tax=Mycobacterium spongiae TaxID=886343 RepID=A0A975K3P9_9MYCO|nr:LppP/LprE family lipoprotein [Mycobacterium spongiae]QUR69844.1 LppP/LprE family lipoprotein [Mycobacterium spongiae]